MQRTWLPPLIASLRRATRTDLRADVSAGITTAIMLVPQAMAYAMLAGLDPIVGLYSATVPLLVYGLLGTSRVLAVGPVAMVSLLVASAAATVPGDPLETAVLLAAMVGLLQLGFGLVGLGGLVRYLSHPVIAGFTSAAALIIGVSQLEHVLGVPLERSHHVHVIVGRALARVEDWDVVTLTLAMACIGALVLLKRLAPRAPRHLLVVVGATLATTGLSLGVATVGDVPAGLPSFAWPHGDVTRLQQLLPMALTISLVGFAESYSVARAFARRDGDALDANQELRALGLANALGSLFGAYPTTGGFSRTAVNAQAGARSGLASIVTASFVALTLTVLTPAFSALPKVVLAAIIMTAVFGLVDIAEARHLWRTAKADFAVFGVTFAATLLLGIEQGLALGVLAQLGQFLYQQSQPTLTVTDPGTNATVVTLRGPLFFGNADAVRAAITRAAPRACHLVIDVSAVNTTDSTARTMLESLGAQLADRGIQVEITGLARLHPLTPPPLPSRKAS